MFNYDIPVEIHSNKSADFNTATVFIKGYNGFSTQINVSNGSTFAATAYIEMSNNGDNWVRLTSDSIALSGATDSGLFDVPLTAASLYRIAVVFTTGSADFSITYNVKG